MQRKSTTITPRYRAYSKDANGSIEALEDTNGSTDGSKYSYDPYGKAEKTDGTDGAPSDPAPPSGQPDSDLQANPFRFEGFYADSGAGTGAGTYDMQARGYLPDTGRFLTEDRYESAASDLGLKSDTLTQDRYAFAAGNPVSNVEADGHTEKGTKDGSHPLKLDPKHPTAGTGSPPSGTSQREKSLPDENWNAKSPGTDQTDSNGVPVSWENELGSADLPAKPSPTAPPHQPKSKPVHIDPLKAAHAGLAAAGAVPLLGALPDAGDAGLYLFQGDKAGAGLAVAGLGASVIPGADQADSAARIGRLAAKDAAESADAGGRSAGSAVKATRGRGKLDPDTEAEGRPHTRLKREGRRRNDPMSGRVDGYSTFDERGREVFRFRGAGRSHGGIEPPLSYDFGPNDPFGRRARPSTPDEIPNGFD